MGVQLVFVLETNKNCKSDWIYIKETIERFYSYDQAHVKLTPVYMDGKGKYMLREKEVKSKISEYNSSAKHNQSNVIYCFDCDDYDTKQEDAAFLRETQEFCKQHGYEYVWFCKDIERVYLGRKVSDSQKKAEAAKFKAKKWIKNTDKNNLSATSYRVNTSNLLTILDQFTVKSGNENHCSCFLYRKDND